MNPRAKSLSDPVVESFKRKLSIWNRNYLFIGGRLTLIKASLSIPLYCMSLFKLLAPMAKKLEKCQRDLLWEGNSDKKKIHLVSC